MEEKLREASKGITLIALVITIIILLILASITISALSGDNGILKNAARAKQETERAQVVELAQLDILAKQTDNLSSDVTASDLKTILDKYFDDVPEAKDITKDTILTPKEEYGSNYKITVSDIYNGEIIEEKQPIDVAESYTANFADMDGNGTADGIIYADLAVGGSGIWNDDDWSNYSYEAETGLKEYYIEEENYTEPKFGNVTGNLIAPIKGTTGKDRFYVMALEDLDNDSHYWYYNAYGKLDNYISTSTNDFGKGKENTNTMIQAYEDGKYGEAYTSGTYTDLWGLETLKNKVSEGWFVPSKSEWAAFGDMATTKSGLTTGNYSTYGLNDWYWSSSQYSTHSAYFATFLDGCIDGGRVDGSHSVRLSATF